MSQTQMKNGGGGGGGGGYKGVIKSTFSINLVLIVGCILKG